MSTAAKSYIGLILAGGAAILFLAGSSWSWSQTGFQFAAFLGFVVFASTLKIRIPGMTSTMSPNFAFILVGMASFNFSEVVAACLVAALAQSLWRPKRLRLVQVLFSAATLVLSGAFAFSAGHWLLHGLAVKSAPALIVFAGTLYMPTNTLLVSVVVGLTQRHSMKHLYRQCYDAVFPYFILGIAFTGFLCGTISKPPAWQSSLLLAPAMILAYAYFLGRPGHAKENQNTTTREEDAELVTASYHR